VASGHYQVRPNLQATLTAHRRLVSAALDSATSCIALGKDKMSESLINEKVVNPSDCRTSNGNAESKYIAKWKRAIDGGKCQSQLNTSLSIFYCTSQLKNFVDVRFVSIFFNTIFDGITCLDNGVCGFVPTNPVLSLDVNHLFDFEAFTVETLRPLRYLYCTIVPFLNLPPLVVFLKGLP